MIIKNKDVFGEDYVDNLKKMLGRCQSSIKAISEGTVGIYVSMRIEDMEEIAKYCKKIGIMDKIILHDESDKNFVKEHKGGIVLSNNTIEEIR